MTPHLYFTRFLDDANPDERAQGMMLGLSWLETCNEVWVFGANISTGMQGEIDRANALGIPVRHLSEIRSTDKPQKNILCGGSRSKVI
jgi:hypothetical protein